MNLDEYNTAINNYMVSPEFSKLDDAVKQQTLEDTRLRFIEENPDQDIDAVNRITENANKNFLRGTGRGRYAPSPEELNNIYFPNQEPGYDSLSKEQKIEKIEEFKLTIPELAKNKPAQAEDFEFFLNQSTRELERRANGEGRGKIVDLSVRATQGLVAGLARYTGFESAAQVAEGYFHENPEFDEDFSSYLAQGIGDVGAGMAIFIGTALTTKGLGGGAATAMKAGTGASLASNSIMRYNEAYHQAIELGLDEDKATKAGLSAVPAAAIDVLGDRIIAGNLMPNNINKIFTTGTLPEKKKALFDLMKDNSNKAKLFEVGRSAAAEGVTEVLGDYVASYMPYLTHGYDDYVPTDKELALSFAVGSILGGGIATATSGIGLKKKEGATETTEDASGESTITPRYDNKDQMRLGETNRNIDVLNREQQTEVFNLLSSGKYKEAYQLSTNMLKPVEAQPDTSTPLGLTVDVESEVVNNTPTNETESTGSDQVVIPPPLVDLETDVKIELGRMLEDSDPDTEYESRNARINSVVPDRNILFSKIIPDGSRGSNTENKQKAVIDALAVKWVNADPSRSLNEFYQKININFPATPIQADLEAEAAEPSPAVAPNILSVLDSSGILDESFSPEERTELATTLGVSEINSETITSLDDSKIQQLVEALLPTPIATSEGSGTSSVTTSAAEQAVVTVTNPINPSSVAQEAARILEVRKKRVKERFKNVTPEVEVKIPIEEAIGNFESITLEEFLNNAINNSENQSFINAYQKLLNSVLAKNPGVRIVFGNFNIDGAYYGPDNTIYIGRGDTITLTHEITHALTQADINIYVESRPESTYKQKLKAARKDPTTPDHIKLLIDVYQRAAIVMDRQSVIGQDAQNITKISAMDRQTYAFINLHEFVAEAMSNAEFQEALAGIPYNGKNLWQVIVETLSQAFDWMSSFANPELIMRSNGRNSLAATMSSVENIIFNQFTQGELARAEQGARILENTTPGERWKNNINYSPSTHEGILYHGGTYPGGKPKASARGALGYGFYLTPDETRGRKYVEENGWGEKLSGGRLSAFSVKLKNPIRVDWTGPTDFVESMALQQVGVTEEKAAAMIEKAMEEHGYLGKEILSRGTKLGHDGIELYRNGELAEVVVWNMNDAQESFLTFMDEVDINNINYSPSSARSAFNPESLTKRKGVQFKSRELLIDIPIVDFLAMADPLVKEERDTAKKAIQSGEPLNEIPFLMIDDSVSPSKITGHEGRHRAKALAEAGYETMPVIWHSNRIRFSEQNDSTKFDYIEQWPTQVVSENGRIKMDYPVNREGINNINYSPTFEDNLRQRFNNRNSPVEQPVSSAITRRMDDLYMQEVEKAKETLDFTLLNELVELAARRANLDVDAPLYRGDLNKWTESTRPVYLTPDFALAWDFSDGESTGQAPRKFFVKNGLRLAKAGDVVNGITVKTSSWLNRFGVQNIPWTRDRGVTSADLKKEGYDGMTGLVDGSDKFTEVVLVDGNLMKLADPITYDENGKVIPLSQRFNPASNMINYSPESQHAQRVANSYKKFHAIIKSKLNDKSDFRTIQIISELGSIRATDVARMEPEMQEYFFALVDNVYQARKSGINNPQARIESDTVLSGIQEVKELIESYAIQDIIDAYDGLIDFTGVDITNREGVEALVNEYMKNEGLLEDTVKNSSKAAERMEKIYNKYKLKFNEIRAAAIERFVNAENYLNEIQAMHGDVHEEYLSTFIKAHYTYLANVDVSDMKGKELYNHFYSMNHLMDNSFMGFELTAAHIGRQRDANQKIGDQAGKFRDPVMDYGKLLMTVDKINQSAELQQVQAGRLSGFNEAQALIKEIMLPLYDSIQRTSYNRKIKMQNEWISEKTKFEETLGRDMTYEDRIVMSIAGRLVQYEAGRDADSELKKNIAKERKSITNIITNGSPDNRKEFRTKVLPMFEQMVNGATTMADFMTNLPNMMKGTMDIETGKERAALLFKAQEIFSEFDAESKIISEGFHHTPFRKVINYMTNDVTTDMDTKGEYDITDALSKWEYHQNKTGLNNKAGHLHTRQHQLGERDYYSYNIENTINRNFERIAVDNATISERFILKSRLKKGSQLNNIISTDNEGTYHAGRAEFLLDLGKTLVNNAFSRGEPMNILVGGLRKMTNAFARVTLSGMHHIVMQPLSAMSDYAVRTGNIKGWFDAAQSYVGNMQKYNDWFEEHYMWTAERGALEAMALDVRRSPVDDDKSFMNTPAMKWLEGIYEGAGKIITFSIRQGDNFSSKVTILAEYTRLLKEKGYKMKSIDDFDFKTVEGRILTEATLNVERNINTSNKIQRGELFSDRRQTTTVLRNMLVAFASHQSMLATQMNQAVRDMLELRAIRATKGQLEQKVRTIGAIMMQSFVFVTGRYAIGTMMAAGMISLIKDLYDDEEGTIEALQEKVLLEQKKGDPVKIEHAMNELANAQTVRSVVTKMENRSMSFSAYYKQLLKDQMGSMFIGFSSETVSKLNPVFLVTDMYQQHIHTQSIEEISRDYQGRIRAAKERGAVKEAASLTEKLTMLEASEYVPFNYSDTGGVGLGGLYGPTLNAFMQHGTELAKGTMGLQEVNYNDLILAAAVTGMGQADIRKFFNAVDTIEDKQWKRNNRHEEQRIPAAELRKREALKRKRQKLLNALD